jgi:hypothetical protein
VYKSELDTGVPKGNLGSILIGHPALLLLDLPTWHWVCGTRFQQKDFLLPVPPYREAITLRYAAAQNRWPNIDAVKYESVEFYLKQILRIIHLLQLERAKAPYQAFSYSGIRERAKGMPEEALTQASLEIRAAGWDFNMFMKYKPLYADTLKGIINP